jgi:hypothetical protein
MNRKKGKLIENVQGFTHDELSLFKAMRKQLVEIEYDETRNVFEILLKDSKSKIAGSISLQLSSNLMIYPLEALDAIITAYWMNEVVRICKGEYTWKKE